MRYAQGGEAWSELIQIVEVPQADDCGPIDDHAWQVYLYSFSPVEDDSPVWYDDVRLHEVDGWPLNDLEEDEVLGVGACQRFSDRYSLTACHPQAVDRTAGGPAGGQHVVLTGLRDLRQTLEFSIPVRPATLYRIATWLRIESRRVFNYLNLDYPRAWVQQRDGLLDLVDLTKGIWSGLYDITVDGVSILPPIIKDAPYRSPSEVDWFQESAYFRTGPSQMVASVRIELTGFEGRLRIDGLTVSPATSVIEDRYLHLPLAGSFQGMTIRQVTTEPLGVTTNAARYRLGDDSIDCYRDEVLVARLRFPRPILAGLRPSLEPGNVFMANDDIALSIAADSVLVAKLLRPITVSVSGPQPGYHAFEAGVVFATDYERGILFGPLRTSVAVRSMPMRFDSASRLTSYDDSDFAMRGLQFWRMVRDFQASWQVDYEFGAGDGFIAQVFPPKDFDAGKYCAERMHTVSANTVERPDADFAYSLAKAGAHVNVGLVWMHEYAAAQNDLQPPEEYCRDAHNRYVHCDSPDVARRDPVNIRFDVTGPYRVGQPEAFRRLVSQAHKQGMRLLVYMSPEFCYTRNVDHFLADLKALIDDYGVDGVYFDGLYPGEPLRSLELVRKTRNLLGSRFYVQHTSWETTLIRRSYRFRAPFLDAQADLLWLGEGVKAADSDTWRLNFCGRDVSNTVSGLLGELRPVNYDADADTSAALSLSPEQQVARSLACQGQFIVSPYSEMAYIHDGFFERWMAYEARVFREPYDRYCLGVTCGNGRCDVGESILDCAADCAPPKAGARLEGRGGVWRCAGGDSVAQWLLDGQPLYRLHYTFDGPLALDVSGHEHHPAADFGEGRRPPELVTVDGRTAMRFDGTTSLDGQASAAMDFDGAAFSILASLRTASARTQAVFSLETDGGLVLGLDGGRLAAWLPDANKRYGVEEIREEGCYAGRCLFLQHHDATWQGAWQAVGTLIPGAEYAFAARFRTSPSHRGFINLHDNSWKNANCRVEGRSFAAAVPGTDAWHLLGLVVTIPPTDDCGDTTADDEWGVYLYGHDPVGDSQPILYDDVSLRQVAAPDLNRVANAGFEEGFAHWGHSSYIPPTVYATETTIADGSWHTVGLTYAPPTLRLFIDGREELQRELAVRPARRFARWAMGSRLAGTVAEGFVGLLDDLAVAGRALDAAQVSAYRSGDLRQMPHVGRAGCVVLDQGRPFTAVADGRLLMPWCGRVR